jgi:hypothetical protein
MKPIDLLFRTTIASLVVLSGWSAINIATGGKHVVQEARKHKKVTIFTFNILNILKELEVQKFGDQPE